MGSSVLITVAHLIIMRSLLSLITLSICVASIRASHTTAIGQGQATDAPNPDYDKRGCPPLENPLPCFGKGISCIHEDKTNIYKTVRARSWWHCGKACLPATKCEYWTFRHHQRKCYLLKSCCLHDAQGFQSGDQYCPGYDD